MNEEEVRAILAKEPKSKSLSMNEAEVRAILKKPTHSQQQKEFSWPSFLGEQFAKGVFSAADLGEMIGTLGGLIGPNQPPISERTKAALKQAYDLDLDSQGEGTTDLQKIVGKGANWAGASIAGPGKLLANAALGAGLGATSGALEHEAGLPPLAADLVAILGPIGAAQFAKKMLSGEKLTAAEQKIAALYKEMMGEEELANTLTNLSKDKSFPVTGYEPVTAEVAESPVMAQIHRARTGVPGSGIAPHQAEQQQKLISAMEARELAPIESNALQNELNQELANRKAFRHEETEPLYEAVRQNKEELNPKNVKKFLRASEAKGDIEKDINYVKKAIEPKRRLTPEEKANNQLYKKAWQEAEPFKGKSVYQELTSELPKPKNVNPTVSELMESRKAINSKIGKRKRAGQAENVRELTLVKKELDKDLEHIPAFKKAIERYRELSPSIDEIKKHPALKKALESRSNNLMSGLFDKNSADNMKALKKAIGSNKQTWDSVEDAVMRHMRKSITNTGNNLSPAKLEKYLEKHGKALEEVFTKDQLQAMREIQDALKGRHKAVTLGEVAGSPTQSRLRTEKDIKERLGLTEPEMSGLLKRGLFSKAAHAGVSAVPFVGKYGAKGIDTLLYNWSAGKEARLMKLLDKVQTDKEFAKKILSYKPKNQAEFNRFINMTLRQGAQSILSDQMKKE